MSYATVDDMIDRFGKDEITRLSDVDQRDRLDDAVVDKAIAEAQEEVDLYLAKRGVLPLATVPAIVKRLTCNVARYMLYKDAATDQVRELYKRTIEILKGLADGSIELGSAEQAEEAGEVKGDSILVAGGPGRIFGRGDGF